MKEYYYNEAGQIAVLVSHDFGAGWSTWDDHGIDLATDKRIVEKYIELSKTDMLRKIDISGSPEEKAFEEWLASIGYKGVYVGGFADCVIEWVDKGTPIRIDEYDGFETLVIGYRGYTTL